MVTGGLKWFFFCNSQSVRELCFSAFNLLRPFHFLWLLSSVVPLLPVRRLNVNVHLRMETYRSQICMRHFYLSVCVCVCADMGMFYLQQCAIIHSDNRNTAECLLLIHRLPTKTYFFCFDFAFCVCVNPQTKIPKTFILTFVAEAEVTIF